MFFSSLLLFWIVFSVSVSVFGKQKQKINEWIVFGGYKPWWWWWWWWWLFRNESYTRFSFYRSDFFSPFLGLSITHSCWKYRRTTTTTTTTAKATIQSSSIHYHSSDSIRFDFFFAKKKIYLKIILPTLHTHTNTQKIQTNEQTKKNIKYTRNFGCCLDCW